MSHDSSYGGKKRDFREPQKPTADTCVSIKASIWKGIRPNGIPKIEENSSDSNADICRPTLYIMSPGVFWLTFLGSTFCLQDFYYH